jgi:subtilisin family serine protease
LQIDSDAEDNPRLSVALRGQALAAPVAQLTPAVLSVELAHHDAPREFTAVLSNTGGHTLTWSYTGIREQKSPASSTPSAQKLSARDLARIEAAINQGHEFKLDQVIVGFKEGYTEFAANQSLSALNAKVLRHLAPARKPGNQAYRVLSRQALLLSLPTSTRDGVLKALAALRQDPHVAYAEPNYIYRTSRVPNDPEFARLYGLHNVGQSGGVADADIDAPEAWDNHTGGDAVVGIIDTGIDYLHPDLAENIWVNPGEIPGNGLDDDGNGYADDVHGYDFANDDADPMDDHFHGTHVAGTIAAVGNNGLGVVGVCWKAKVAALKFLDQGGSGSLDDAVDAVAYATAMGMPITSNSWGGGGYSQALKDVIDAAGSVGSLFVAAAGNSGSDMDIYPDYPAGYDSPNILSVAATDAVDAIANFSNYGLTTVDLGAPGVDIYSTMLHGDYGYMSGTSMATPHVSGAAALLLSYNSQATLDQIKAALLAGVDIVADLQGRTATGGRLNVQKALAGMSPPWISIAPRGAGEIQPQASQTFAVRIDPAHLVAGAHQVQIVFATNDPLRPTLSLDVSAKVSACRSLALAEPALDFGAVWIGQSGKKSVQLMNSCNDTTTVHQVDGLGSFFSVSTVLPIKVPPFGAATLELGYAPTSVAKTKAALTVRSNAQTPALILSVMGSGVKPPTLETNPNQFALTMDPGQTLTKTLTVRNRGGANLEVQFKTVLPNPVAQAFREVAGQISGQASGQSNEQGNLVRGLPRSGANYAQGHGMPKSLKPNAHGQPKALASNLNILYLTTVYTDSSSYFLAGLRGLPQVAKVDVLDGTYVTPDAAYLAAYDQVIVAASGYWSDAVATGNALADYVDAGGRVTLMTAAIASEGGWSLAGRMASPDFMPIEMVGPGEYGYTSTFVTHPITEGMASLECYLPTAAHAAAGEGVSLGAYENGQIIGAYHQSKPIVAINVYPEDGYWGGDLIMMLGNTLHYLDQFNTWFIAEPASIVVQPGKAVDVKLTFNSKGLLAGAYTGDLAMLHNVPGKTNPTLIPISLQVKAKRCLSAVASIDFGKVWVGSKSDQVLELENACNETVTLQQFVLAPSWFQSSLRTPVQIQPFSKMTISLSYLPTNLLPGLGLLVVKSDAQNNPLLKVVLKGQAIRPPEVSVTPGALQVTADPGLLVTRNIKVSNTGGDTLRLNAATQSVENGLLPPPIPNPTRPKQPPQCKPGKPRMLMNLRTLLAHQHPAKGEFREPQDRREPRYRPTARSLRPVFQPLASQLRVLYFHTAELDSLTDDPFVSALRALPNVGVLDMLDGRYQTPNLEYLQQYDIVVVSQDWGFADPIGAGDVLADYVDQGGRACLLGMTFTPYEGYSLAGRIMQPEYLPLQRQSESWENRDAVFENHPINAGVTSIESFLAIASDTLAPQGMPLGRYSNGYLTGAYHKSKPVVALNFFPFYGYWSGDVPRLMGNTFDYLASFVGWLYPEPYQLTIPPGKSAQLKVVFDTRKTPASTYLAQLALLHNAPATASPLRLPITLKVQAKSCLIASLISLDFGKVRLGGDASREIVLTNACNEATTVQSTSASSPVFALETNLPLVVPAFSEIPVSFKYQPDDLSADQGWVELRSNAANAPNLRINLKGVAVQPPTISATPTHFSESLQPGETVTRTVRIGNAGGDTLDVSVKVVVQSEEDVPVPDSMNSVLAANGPRLIPTNRTGKGGFGAGLVPADFRTLAIDTTLPDSGTPSPGVGKRILYVHALYLDTLWDPIVSAMRYAPGVASLDLLNAQYVTPNAAYLAQYDMVAVAGDSAWADDVVLGNALADYVDEGGRVLVMMGALLDKAGIGISGRFAGPEYLPMAKGSYATYDYAYSFIPHPITHYVGYVGTYFHASSSTLQGDGQPLGWYQSGDLVGAYQENKPVVALNFLPAYYAWFGDFSLMVANTVEYLLAESKVVRAKPMRLRVPPGQTSEITLTFGDAQLEAGDYSARIELNHNAPVEPSPLSITADVHVEGLKKLVASPAESDLGESVVGQSAYGYWSLENQGNAPVTVTSVFVDSPDLYGDWPEAPFTLAPQQILSGYLIYAPQQPGPWNASVRFVSDGGNAEMLVRGMALAPAKLALTTAPDPLHFILPRGGASKGSLSLANLGDEILYFNLRLSTQADSDQPDSGDGSDHGSDTLVTKAASFAPEAYIPLAKGAADARSGKAVAQTVGGPDEFGHRWIDSRDSVGPQFAWVEIATPEYLLRTVSGCDDCSEQVDLTFDFGFYGEKHGTVYVNANGYLTMVKPSQAYSHTPLPSAEGPEAMIAPFFRDLYPAGGGAVYARDFGDSLVVTWNDVIDFENTGRYTFQVMLRKNGSISYAYKSMQGVTDKATVGMQNFSRDDGLTLVFNGAFVADSLAVHTSTWARLGTEWGYVPGRTAAEAELLVDALATPEGIYNGTVEVYSGGSTSGPEWHTLPVTLEVVTPE